MALKQTLTELDWIKAAFRALTAGGAQAIKAESIARGLKVSKGSFYWHFKDVADLKAKMLRHWQDAATDEVISNVDGNATTPLAQLELLLVFATDHRGMAYGGENAEAAIRDWARYDAKVAETLRRVDVQRLAYLEQLFKAHGIAPQLCTTKAAVLYAGLIGLEGLGHTGAVNVQADLKHLLEQLLK